MNKKEIKQLLPQTIIIRNKDPHDIGMVFEVSKNGFYAVWNNGQMGWMTFTDAENIHIKEVSSD